MTKSHFSLIITYGIVISLIFTACGSEKPVRKESNNGFQTPEFAPDSKPKLKIEDRSEMDISCVDSSKINREEICYDLYDPVCGCDSVTYSNECHARKNGVLKWAHGACK